MSAIAISVGAIIAVGVTYGQRFEVVSVKPTNEDQFSAPSGGYSGHGRLSMTNVTLKRCIMSAYGVGASQVTGGPEWLDSDRFEIDAKAEDPVNEEAVLMGMFRTLLADRFKLAIHREVKPRQVLTLTVAARGPKLERASEDESAGWSGGRGLIRVSAMTMDQFAEILSRLVGAPVVNQTALEGVFDVKLVWDLEDGNGSTAHEGERAPDLGSRIVDAIKNQLGLQLKLQKADIEILVIDHAERPSAN